MECHIIKWEEWVDINQNQNRKNLVIIKNQRQIKCVGLGQINDIGLGQINGIGKINGIGRNAILFISNINIILIN